MKRIKPNKKKVEIEFTLDTERANYDSDAKMPISNFKLVSKPVPPKTNYAVGVMKDGALLLYQCVLYLCSNYVFAGKWTKFKKERLKVQLREKERMRGCMQA